MSNSESHLRLTEISNRENQLYKSHAKEVENSHTNPQTELPVGFITSYNLPMNFDPINNIQCQIKFQSLQISN